MLTIKYYWTNIIIVIIFLTVPPLNIFCQNGLIFNASDSPINKRTSYEVFQRKRPVFRDHLYIQFYLSLWDTRNLGYIFNLTTNNSSYSFNYVYSYKEPSLNFNIDAKSNKLRYLLDFNKLKKRNWIRVKFDFHLKHDYLIVSIDGHKFRLDSLGLINNIKPKIVFGKNQNYKEVPHMAISNLTVGDDNNTYTFPLNEWEGNTVHTSSGEKVGSVENPVWMVNSFYYWRPLFDKVYHDIKGLNFDPLNQQVLIYGKDSVLFLNSSSGNTTTRPYKNAFPLHMILGKSVFNNKDNKLYVYEVHHNIKGKTSIASLDLRDLMWKSIGKTQLQERMHHHNVFYDKNFDSIYIFGGYGGYKYHNTFYTYNVESDAWKQVLFTGDSITPRLLAATGNSNNPDEIFIFGGYGNESGNQIVGGHQYYDLYRVNLKNHTIQKCWDIRSQENFVPTNNLVLSTDGQYLYALCYPHGITKTFLQLYKFAIKDGSYELLGSPIPITAERIETDINLFLSKNTNELLCAVQEFLDEKKSNIKIYSLAYPPVSKIGTTADQAGGFLRGGKSKYITLISIALVAIMLAVWMYIAQKKKKRAALISKDFVPEEDLQLLDYDNEELGYHQPAIRKNAVYLIGEFTVFDKKGMDITHLFSPKIRQLFILILLYSFDGNGIHSKKISYLLWADKDIDKTKNIKGVTLNHLRNILSDIVGIELVFSGNNYVFEIGSEFFCDYYTVLTETQQGNVDRKKLISEYFYLISRGPFLKDVYDAWINTFKNAYEEKITETLSANLADLYKEKQYSFVLAVSKTILDIDPFNEMAIKYQLNSYRKTKGIEYCRKVYDQFKKEYEKSLGEEYSLPLDKILIT